MSHIESALSRQLKWRQKKLVEAAYPHIAECHEKAIARLIVQRICSHEPERIVSLNYRITIYQCRRCKFKFAIR